MDNHQPIKILELPCGMFKYVAIISSYKGQISGFGNTKEEAVADAIKASYKRNLNESKPVKN